MRRITASLLSSALIAPAVVLAPTVSLPHLLAGAQARPKAVDPVVTRLTLGAGVAAAASGSAGSSAGSSAVGSRPSATASGAPAVLTGTVSTKEFETLAVTWDLPKRTAPSIAVTARVRGDDGWGAWFPLDVDDVNATAADLRASGEGSSRGYRGGTEPYWAGRSDGVQVRIDVTKGSLPQGLKVELIDPGQSDYDALVGVQPPGTAVSAAARPTIHSRAEWGANESKVRGAPTVMSTIKAAVIHHTAGKNGYSRVAVPGILRATYAYHLSRGWDDIGYNVLVDRFGRIWEGRGGGVEKAIQGAHSGGFNWATFGVSVMGNYAGRTRPSRASLDAVARVVAWKLDLFRVDPRGTVRLTSAGSGTSRYRAGTTVTKPTIMGHRDVGYTACPGKNIYVKLASIRRAVVRYTKAQLVGVRQNTTAVTYGQRGPAVTFRPIVKQAWRLSVADACTGAAVGAATGSATRRQTVTAAWDGRTAGRSAKAGVYRTTVTSTSTRGAARPFTKVFGVKPLANPPLKTGVPGPDGPGGFHPVTPTRLYDSRWASGQALGPDGRLDLQVAGRAGVPATGVTAVVLNLTSPCASASTSFTARPARAYLSGPAALSTGVGAARSAEVAVAVGAGGHVSIRNAAGVAHLRVDVVGYYSNVGGAGLHGVGQVVVLDTLQTGVKQPLAPAAVATVSLPAITGVPQDSITAVLVDLSAIGPSATGQVSGYAYGTPANGVTSLAYTRRTDSSALATVAVRDGRFVLRNTGGTTHVRAVLVGVFSTEVPARFEELTPRTIWGPSSGAAVGSTARSLRVVGGSTGVPLDARSVALRVTATGTASRTALSVWGGDATVSPPLHPVVRVGRSATVTTSVLVPVTPSGLARIKAVTGSARVKVSLIGYNR